MVREAYHVSGLEYSGDKDTRIGPSWTVVVAPQPVKQCTSKQEADVIKQKLADAGATAEIR